MAKKKWDENKVSRDESGRFVSQAQPMQQMLRSPRFGQQPMQQMRQSPGAGAYPMQQMRQSPGTGAYPLQQMRQSPGTGAYPLQEMRRSTPNNTQTFMRIELSSAKPKRRSRGKLA